MARAGPIEKKTVPEHEKTEMADQDDNPRRHPVKYNNRGPPQLQPRPIQNWKVFPTKETLRESQVRL
jgi:hypothetical protein